MMIQCLTIFRSLCASFETRFMMCPPPILVKLLLLSVKTYKKSKSVYHHDQLLICLLFQRHYSGVYSFNLP